MPYKIYSKRNCSYCATIKKVLEQVGESYIELTLDNNFTKEEFIRKFGYGASFPRIMEGDQLIGGANETIMHLRKQGLV
jgi:glutaredoxin